MHRVFTIFAAILCCLTLVPGVQAQAEQVSADGEAVPMSITSQRMDYDQQADTVVFTGDVHVTRADLTIWADSLTVEFEPREDGAAEASALTAGAGQGVKRITARGNVRLNSQGREGTSERLIYEAATRVIRMEGSPVLRDGGNSVSGAVVRLFLDENRSEVEGGDDAPVEAIFLTPKDVTGQETSQ